MFVEIGGMRIGTSPEADIVVASAGVENWYSSPASETEFTSRRDAPGAYRAAKHKLGAKTVVLHVHMLGWTRAENLALYDAINSVVQEPHYFRVSDDDHDTYVKDAYVTTALPATFIDKGGTAVITLQINNPIRYTWRGQTVMLTAGARVGGFDYDVEYPIDYNDDAGNGVSQSGSVVNLGTYSTAPVIVVQGNLPGGFTLLGSGGKAIEYPQTVFPSAPVTIDCDNRVAICNGVNVSRNLTRREWFDLPARGGSMTVTLVARDDVPVGQAWAELTARSAWI